MDKEVASIAYAQLPYEADNNMSREVMVLKATRAAIEAAGGKIEE